MSRLYIIAEGLTEEQFITEVLRPYLNDFGIYDVRAILLETSSGFKGGDIKYARYKRNAEILLRSENDIVLTSLIDFFKLKSDFPKSEEAKKINDKSQRVTFLETAIAEQINDRRFLPYIQLHEFEGLLFSTTSGFEYLGDIPNHNMEELEKAVALGAPELINDGAETAPSKRLEKLIPGYDKPIHGPIIAAHIGLAAIMEKCPRFNNWITALIQRMTFQ